ncbi:unnamed protein product [Bursaphelenchus xylophilus]|uniref:Threonylcarbamoyl-AMP synthase n=1 Tax=Bursaphelenchus xylophilus TaxID=6326 RepID=A0A1I7S8S2_BURXY|nr:unnamed protein product [Bursaphelenchus xylophilus]CAG9085783.1 unnamed protein product [Bursaphelenchus xylophilus]
MDMNGKSLKILQMGDVANRVAKKCRFLNINEEAEQVLEQTGTVLSHGGVVALPTDTVYGLVSLYSHSQQLLDIKKRDANKPLGLFFANPDLIFQYTYPTVGKDLLCRLLPGRVTLLLKRLPSFPSHFVYENNLLGVRVPDSLFIQKLCARFDEPIAQTSANSSGKPSSVQPDEFKELWESIDLVLTEESRGNKGREGSTVIDLSEKGSYSIVRDGCAKDHFEQILIDYGLKQR